jgi:hypothetical protein
MTWPDRSYLLLAGLVTVLNALKPAVIDDTAYLLFARHLAHHPLDPYGFELFWYSQPEPAMEILLPPVLPSWLALGIALFGEHLFLLKLWLFPFAVLLCGSVRRLLHRFAPGCEGYGTALFALSPVVLPLFSFMLDVPALALGAAAVAVFVSAVDERRFNRMFLSGLLAGLAMQTKYSMLTVPVVMAAYALIRVVSIRQLTPVALASLAVLTAASLFAAWEYFLTWKYGTSHFLLHVRGQGGVSVFDRLTNVDMIGDLLKQFGGLAVGWIALLGPVSVGRTATVVGIGGFAVLAALLCSVPYRYTVIDSQTDLPTVTFFLAGLGVFGILGVGIGRAGIRRDTVFLIGWIVIEAVGTLGMTPFPAARRVCGVCLATTVLGWHLLRSFSVPRWAIGAALGWGFLLFFVECWDAYPEKVLAERAAEVVHPAPGETVWFTGHWGFHYYADRHGMTHFISGRSILRRGDWLVLPMMPDWEGFYRPWPPDRELPKPTMQVEPVADLVWDDWLSGQTNPNLHGGSVPLKGRDHPRLRVVVYRVQEDWKP